MPCLHFNRQKIAVTSELPGKPARKMTTLRMLLENFGQILMRVGLWFIPYAVTELWIHAEG